jgi:hypothetical protein
MLKAAVASFTSVTWVPELHRESAGGFDARVGQQANQGITDRDHAWYFVNE